MNPRPAPIPPNPRRGPTSPSHTPPPEPKEVARPRRGGTRRQGAGTAAKAAAAKRKRMHVIEAARMYHALEDPPRKTQADIARDLGRSPGYVSTLCRVGEAIRDLPAEEREALRQPHVTYSAVATLVARQKGPRALLAALQALATHPPRRARSAIGGAALWTRPEPREPAADPLDPIPAPRGAAPPDRPGHTFSYTFDEAAWRADFDAALDGFDAHLRTLLEGVMRRARRVLGADGPLSLGASLPRPAVASRGALDTREAGLARLAALDVALRRAEEQALAARRSHRAQLAAFEVERAAADTARRAGGAAPAEPISADEIDADLAD